MQSNVVELNQPAVDLEIPEVAPNGAALILSGDGMDRMMKLATIMASGRSTIPKHLHGNTGDCMAVIMQAMSWRMNPFAVAQKTHLVNGVLGFEAQLINAAILSSGLLQGRPSFTWDGDWSKVIGNYKEYPSKHKEGETYRRLASTPADEKGCAVTISATLKGEDKPRELMLLLTQAGVRNSPLWADDPRQQLAYLAIKRWARLYVPDVILGVYSPDELAEVRPGERDMGTADVVDAKPDIAARVRQATGHESKATTKPAADKPPTLAAVLEQIAASSTPEEMKQAGEMSTKLVDGEDRDKARVAYRARMAALKKAAADAAEAAAAAEAGATQQQGGPTYAEVADMISKADSVAAVNAALDLARSFKDDGQREDLIEMGTKKIDALTPAGD